MERRDLWMTFQNIKIVIGHNNRPEYLRLLHCRIEYVVDFGLLKFPLLLRIDFNRIVNRRYGSYNMGHMIWY